MNQNPQTKPDRFRFFRRWLDSDEWEEVTEERVLEVFSRSFVDPDLALHDLKKYPRSIGTSYADYRAEKVS